MIALAELARVFLRLGLTSFGGPAAHIALMRDELVTRRGWLNDRTFLDLVSAANLIPGPNSTEVAIHIGRLRAGIPGLLVAGVCFILPAACIVTALAFAYVRYGALPQISAALYAVKPVVLVIVVHALLSLARPAIGSIPLVVVAVAVAIASLSGVGEIPLLLAAAIAFIPSPRARLHSVPVWLVFTVFLKIGSVLYGSGYVLLAFLRSEIVERGWLTEAQILDAVAIGQITPGPLFTTATFIGFIVAGWPGAAAATAGIFLPAFVFVAVTAPFLARLRASARASSMLDAVNAASWALMAVVAWQLGAAAIVDVFTAALAVGAAVSLFWLRVSSTWILLAGAAIGIAAAVFA